jgi:hypothetical protein
MAHALWPVDVNPQKSLLADLPFHIDDFHASRSRRTLRCVPDAVQFYRHLPPEACGPVTTEQ